MSTIQHRAQSFALVSVCLAALAIAGCTHNGAGATNLGDKLAPFTQTRSQAVAMVTNAKRVFDAGSINQLMLAYTDLELKSNAYAGFLVESAKIGTFDTRKNDEYAFGLRNAIDAFNVTYATLQSASPTPVKTTSSTWLADAWVAPFAQSVQAYWERYHDTLASSPQTVAYVTQQIKSDTIYPNFEDIATERVR
ncbi:MAG TPA: hypothetical protein VGX02_02035 [Candidatus Eremiobacteraceae bacterium]|jgi:hypothetical protein|nr:hypothetical protein [Candidatus Eremiobacteraceae bacterium]